MPRLIARREFLAGAAGVLSGGAPAGQADIVYLIATAEFEVPQRIAGAGVVFTRAYVATPDAGSWARSLASGVFPHALPRDLPLDPASIGLKGRWVEVDSAVEADRVLTELDAARDHTIVFTRRPAGSGWEDKVTRVPLAIRCPKLTHGGAYDFLTSTVDVTPTLASLHNIKLSYAVQGQDLSAILRAGGGTRPESVYAEGDLRRPSEWRMVVRGLDKLVVSPNLKVLHLFNLGEDSGEQHDLVEEPGQQLKIDEMLAFVRLWMRQTADGMDPSGLRRR
jgi:arylsulfatase A-like enzyme